MQKRHLDPGQYFEELAATSRKYFVPYAEQFRRLQPGDKVLEIGCGCGGNLVPYAERGLEVTGVDITPARIAEAKEFFRGHGLEGRFQVADILREGSVEGRFDLIIVHDVIEHLSDKKRLFDGFDRLSAPGGVVFVGFPAWQMPFGGHQQICRNKMAASLPFYHLLPRPLYRWALKAFGETDGRIEELLDIKSCRVTVESFTKLAKANDYRILDRRLYLINPHYESKFGLKPRKLAPIAAGMPYLRNFFSTSCFFILAKRER